ncbi:MAG: hypothetical protein R2737_18300 [Candidatus Nanopelagicales bacterium]
MFARIRAHFAPAPLSRRQQILREWQVQRERAISRNDELEIDQIFSRALEEAEASL